MERYSNEAPFGGISVVLCGDFFQLPPVLASSLYSVLKSAVRQKDDAHYAEILQDMREGSWEKHCESLNGRVIVTPTPELKDVLICCHSNNDRLALNEYLLQLHASAGSQRIYRIPMLVQGGRQRLDTDLS